jgi:hypothetical protein
MKYQNFAAEFEQILKPLKIKLAKIRISSIFFSASSDADPDDKFRSKNLTTQEEKMRE